MYKQTPPEWRQRSGKQSTPGYDFLSRFLAIFAMVVAHLSTASGADVPWMLDTFAGAAHVATSRIDIAADGPRLASHAVQVPIAKTGQATSAMSTPRAPLVLDAPHPALTLSPDTIVVGGTSQIAIWIDNTNDFPITGLSFVDNLPSGLVIADSGASNYCGGTLTAVPNGMSISLSNGTIDPHLTCVIYVNVVATAVGSWFDHTGIISSSNAAPGDDVGATLMVTNAAMLAAPTVSVSFTPATVALGGYSRLKITVSNNDPTNAIVGAQLFDAFPPGMVAAPNSIVVDNDCSASVYPDTNALRIYGMTIPGGGSCRVVIKVVGTSVGNWSNPSGPVISGNATTAQGASAPFTVVNAALLPAPSLALSFSPPSVYVGNTSDMKLTLTNLSQAASINGIQYLQEYPPGIVNSAMGTIVGNTCGGTLTAPPNGRVVSLAGANIPSGSFCSVTIRITGLWANAFVVSSGVVYSGNAGQTGSAQATITVNSNPLLLNPPAVTKAFLPSTVEVGDASQMTIALSNPNAAPITDAGFTDFYPQNLTNASINVVSGNTCGGTVTASPNGTSVQLSGGTIPLNGCSVVVNVTPTSPSTLVNHTGSVTSANANPGADASAGLQVNYNAGGLLDAPAVTEVFSPPIVPVGGASEMTITLSNPNVSAITGVQFSNTYPPGFTNALSGVVVNNSCGGALAAAASGTSLSLSGGTIPANGVCSVVVSVRAVSGGAHENHTGIVTSANADFSADADATLTVTVGGLLPPPTVTKSFTPTSVPVGGTSTMTISLGNPSGGAITGVHLADIYPAGMMNAVPELVSDTCNFQVAPGTVAALLNNGTIPAGDSCSIVINVLGTLEGSHTNFTGSVYSDNAQTAAPGSATLTVTSSPALLAPPVVSKTFVPDTISVGEASEMTITLANSDPNTAIIGAQFTDSYPTPLHIANAPGVVILANTCGGTLTATADGISAALTDGVVPANGTCIVKLQVVGTSAGVSANHTGTVTSTNANAGADAIGTLTVTPAVAQPDLTPAKTHTGDFSQGQTDATYSLIVFNSGSAPTSGLVTVTDALPGSMTATAMSGPGWTCSPATLTCTRSDSLDSGSGYPAITLTVDVASDAPSSVVNAATVSGGGETNTGNNSVNDPTTIDPASLGPDLTLSKSHAGNFSQGQTGAVYTLVVHNVGASPTSGVVTVDDILPQLPASLTPTEMAGPGWTCMLATRSCARSDSLDPGSNYPAITLTVDVSANAPPNVLNVATVSGGGEANTANSTAGDPTTIDGLSAGPDLTLTKSHAGNFVQGQSNATYSLIAHNVGGAPTSGVVTVADVLPVWLTPAAMSGPGWTCDVQTTSCTRTDPLADGDSYPAITLIVHVSASAPPSVVNTASASGGGETNANNDVAADVTTVDLSNTGGTPQTITFTSTAPVDAVVGGPTYLAIATATSGLPVVLTIDGASATVCTIDNAGVVSFIGAGNCTIDANQGGDATYAPAPQEQQTFAVASAGGTTPQTITFTSAAPANAIVAGPSYFASAMATSGLPVVLTIDGASANVCTIDNGTVSFIGAGTCTIDANQGGDATYAPAPQAQQSFAVADAGGAVPQTIQFTSTAPVAAAVGGPTYLATATATSGLPVGLTIDGTSATVCTINNGTVSFIGAGTCTIDANQGGDATYAPAPQVQQSFAVAGAGGAVPQTIQFTSTAPVDATVAGPSYLATATATSGLPVVLTINGTSATVCAINNGTVTFIGAGTCTIDANQGGDATYAAAPQTQQAFAVASAGGVTPQTIQFTSTAPANATVAGSSYFATAEATSGLPVVLTIDTASATVCTINNGTVSFIGAGLCTIDADQGGDTTYAPAPTKQQSFMVADAGGVIAQTIQFTSTAPAGAIAGGPSYLATAVATSGLPVVLTIDAASASVCAINNGTVTFSDAGTCTIDADQGGDATYAPAPMVQQAFAVGPPAGDIIFRNGFDNP